MLPREDVARWITTARAHGFPVMVTGVVLFAVVLGWPLWLTAALLGGLMLALEIWAAFRSFPVPRGD